MRLQQITNLNAVKTIFFIVAISFLFGKSAFSQNIGVNASGATPHASAMLDVSSTNSGLLIPRVALTATNVEGPITSPATSLMVYNTATAGTSPNNVVPGYYYWNGSAWILFSTTSNSAWSLSGNSGLNPATNFLGNTDDKQLIFKSNNQSFWEFGNRGTLGLTQGYPDYDDTSEKVSYVRSALQFDAPAASFYKPKMWTDPNGNFRVKGSSAGTDYFEFGSTGSNNSGGFEFIVGDDGDEPIVFKSYHYVNGMSEIMRLQSGRMAVGSNSFNASNPEKLLIDAGVTTSYNLMTGKGNIDNYLQINVQNSSAGGTASSDLVATANNGNESSNFIDMGINSSGFTNTSYPIIGGANNAYLYSTGNDFVIGNGTASKSLRFFTGGFANVNERMRIDGTGKVGIGTTTPSEVLDVAGNFELTGAFMPGNSAGTSGYLLTSAGAGVSPTWTNPTTLLGSSYWAMDGNNITGTARSIGTTSAKDFPFITNNTERMRISSAGSVGIGATSFNGSNPEKFLVNAGTTSSVNAIVGRGTINNYLQLNIQNQSNGTSASSDVVATADNGNETANYIDMGINSSGYTGGVMGGANDGYLYNVGQNLLIGTGTSGKSLIFTTGGTAQSTNERMRIDGSGKVGIGNTNPQATLDVSGNYKLGTSGSVLTNMIKTTISINDATTFSNTTTEQVTATITGATSNATVILNPRTALPAGIGVGWVRVSSANTITIGFTNTDAAPRAVGSVTFDVTVIQ